LPVKKEYPIIFWTTDDDSPAGSFSQASVSLVKLVHPKTRIKAVVLTTSFPLSGKSVSGVFVKRLVDALSPRIDVEVLTPCSKSPITMQSDGEYELRCFRYAPRRWQILAHLPGGIPVALHQSRLVILLVPFFLGAMFVETVRASRNADIVHANWSISGFIAGLACRFTRKPMITTLRGEDVSRAEASRLYRLFLWVCMRYGCRVVAVGSAMGQRLRAMFPDYAEKVVVVPNGVSPRLLSINADKSSRERRTELRVLTVGSLIPRKGIDTVIKAIADISDSTGVYLTVVGDGVDRHRLQSLAKEEGVEEKVQFVGEFDPDRVVEFYDFSDVFVLASYSEGRPNVLMEAMAAALPVIASEIDGVKELVTANETGLLFQPGDVNELAKQLLRVSRDIEFRERLACRARQFIVEKRLLWSSTGEGYEEVYQDVLRDYK